MDRIENNGRIFLSDRVQAQTSEFTFSENLKKKTTIPC